jgi:hypothetical protein
MEREWKNLLEKTGRTSVRPWGFYIPDTLRQVRSGGGGEVN